MLWGPTVGIALESFGEIERRNPELWREIQSLGPGSDFSGLLLSRESKGRRVSGFPPMPHVSSIQRKKPLVKTRTYKRAKPLICRRVGVRNGQFWDFGRNSSETVRYRSLRTAPLNWPSKVGADPPISKILKLPYPSRVGTGFSKRLVI